MEYYAALVQYPAVIFYLRPLRDMLSLTWRTASRAHGWLGLLTSLSLNIFATYNS